MASETRTLTSDELADEIVSKIDGYLEGSLTADDVVSYARSFMDRVWTSYEVIYEGAIDQLLAVGPGEYDTSEADLREFRSYLMGERDYVVHFRRVRSQARTG
jgi:hypothetical protein